MTAFTVAPELEVLARDWLENSTYQSTMTSTGYPEDSPAAALDDVTPGPVTRPCVRCGQCDGVIQHPGWEGVAFHLMNEHGYRMDGRKDE